MTISLSNDGHSSNNVNLGKSTPWHTKLLRMVLKIQDIFNSAMSSIKTYFSRVDEAKIHSTISVGILNNRQLLKDSVIVDISRTLEDKHGDSIAINLSHLLYGEISNYELNKPKVLLPITLKGILRNHIVLLAFDRVKKQILFLDSKGYTLKDHFNSELLIQKQFPKVRTVGDLLNQFIDKRPDIIHWKFNVNEKRAQKDSHNCGVYVAECMKRIAEDTEFKDILNNPLSFSKADNSTRNELMELLAPSGPDLLLTTDLSLLYHPKK